MTVLGLYTFFVAWRVNFNNSLSSFKTNIVGVRKLVDFALTVKQTRPAHLVFVSSIGVVKRKSSTSYPNSQLAANIR